MFIRPVLKWAQEKSIGHFTTQLMQNTEFMDLKIRLGFPYLYKHVGNCEHLVIFTSVRWVWQYLTISAQNSRVIFPCYSVNVWKFDRLINPSSDCYVLSKYPIPKDRTRGRFTFCWCCNRLYAKWLNQRWPGDLIFHLSILSIHKIKKRISRISRMKSFNVLFCRIE